LDAGSHTEVTEETEARKGGQGSTMQPIEENTVAQPSRQRKGQEDLGLDDEPKENKSTKDILFSIQKKYVSKEELILQLERKELELARKQLELDKARFEAETQTGMAERSLALDKAKVANPSTYDGEVNLTTLNNWVHQIKDYLKATCCYDPGRSLIIAKSYLRGRAQTYVEQNREHLEGIEDLFTLIRRTCIPASYG
jgi:hypothetical protein